MKTLFFKVGNTGWILSLLALLAGSIPAVAQTFVLTSTYHVGSRPANVVTVDVNNDGKPDLICANGGGDTLTVLTNNGNGTFTNYTTLSVGNSPSVAAADLRGTGKMDLITANFGDGTLLVLTNTGIGGFGSNATYIVGDGPFNVVAADLNNDGRQDLVCANDGTGYDGTTLTVLTNNGNGKFTFAATLTVGVSPYVAAADLRGTGQMDLFTANFYDSTLTVLTNNGHGDFGSNATYHVGDGPFNVVAADVNNDRKLDLVCANNGVNYDGNTLTVLTNNGNGTFTFAATLTVGNLPFVAAADVNADGQADLITANYNDAALTVLTNNGTGVFGSNATYAAGSSPIYVAAADVNNDGGQDILSADAGDDSLTVLVQSPVLNIQWTNQSAVVSWPPGWTNLLLQQNASLVTTHWTNINNLSGTNLLILPAPNGNNFFRLSHP